MEDLLLQIVKESQNAKLTNLRKSAQEAYGKFEHNSFVIRSYLDSSLICVRI